MSSEFGGKYKIEPDCRIEVAITTRLQSAKISRMKVAFTLSGPGGSKNFNLNRRFGLPDIFQYIYGLDQAGSHKFEPNAI